MSHRIFLHVCEGDDVCSTIWVIPNPATAQKTSNCIDHRIPSVHADSDGLCNGVNIAEEFAVAEYFNSGLVVQEDPEYTQEAFVIVLYKAVASVATSQYGITLILSGDALCESVYNPEQASISCEDVGRLVS